jgi:hypothetical protein
MESSGGTMTPDEWNFLKDVVIFVGTLGIAWEGLQTWKRQIQAKTRFPYIQKLINLEQEFYKACKHLEKYERPKYSTDNTEERLWSIRNGLWKSYYEMELSDMRFLKRRLEAIDYILYRFGDLFSNLDPGSGIEHADGTLEWIGDVLPYLVDVKKTEQWQRDLYGVVREVKFKFKFSDPEVLRSPFIK